MYSKLNQITRNMVLSLISVEIYFTYTIIIELFLLDNQHMVVP